MTSTPSPRRRWLRRLALVVAVPVYLALAVVYVRGIDLSGADSAGEHAIDVTAQEMRFDSPLEVEAGWTDITLHNQGGLAHQASIYRLHDGESATALSEALRDDRDAWQGVADPVGGVGGIQPGTTEDAYLDLEPGEYIFTCFLRGGSAAGKSHVQFGMSRVLEVTPSEDDGADLLPATDGEFVLRDDGFVFPDGFDGHGTFTVQNDGTQPHELSIVRLEPGKTEDDFVEFLLAAAAAEEGGPKPSGPPPFKNTAGFTIIDPGGSGLMTLDLDPGSYLAVDFIPDPENDGLPHFLGGLLESFDVTD